MHASDQQKGTTSPSSYSSAANPYPSFFPMPPCPASPYQPAAMLSPGTLCCPSRTRACPAGDVQAKHGEGNGDDGPRLCTGLIKQRHTYKHRPAAQQHAHLRMLVSWLLLLSFTFDEWYSTLKGIQCPVAHNQQRAMGRRCPSFRGKEAGAQHAQHAWSGQHVSLTRKVVSGVRRPAAGLEQL